MTAPIGTGYPDYGRYVAQATKVYIDQTITNIDAFQSLGTFFVGDIPYAGIRFEALTRGFQLNLGYYSNSALSSLLGDHRYHVASGGKLLRSFPVIGPWLNISVTPSAADGICDLKLFSVRSEYVGSANDYTPSRLLFNNNSAVAAGATVSNQATRLYDGEAVWSCFTTLATWTANLYSVNEAGALTHLMRANQTNGNFTKQAFLPQSLVAYDFLNGTGVVGNFWMSVLARPVFPGS